MDIKEFEAFWADHQPDRQDSADFWSRRAQSFDAHSGKADSSAYRRLLVEKTAARAGVGRQDAVLDVGCGPGRHALEFATLAGRVEACDIARGMIERARENAAQAHKDNVNFRVLDWAGADLAELGWERKFRLVFASRTPAVYDRGTLEKMTAASCGCCCLITHVAGENSVRRALEPVMGCGRDPEMLRRGLFCAFNILWLQGYCPEVEYMDRTWRSECPLDEAVLMYSRQFGSGSPLAPDQVTALTEGLRSLSRNGMVLEEGRSKVAVLFWKV